MVMCSPVTCRDLPLPDVCVNVAMQPLTRLNGPMRIIPGTQHSHTPIPSLREEPEWMRTSTLCPFPAGAALFRDPRNWHGATPNLSESPRSVPAAVFSAPWLNVPAKRAMPREVFEALVRRRRTHLPRLCLLLLLLR